MTHAEPAADGAAGDPAATAHLGFATLDTGRAARTGDPEVVYGEGKTAEQCAAILRRLHEAHPERPVLATRVAEDAAAGVLSMLADLPVQHHSLGRCITVAASRLGQDHGGTAAAAASRGRVGIVSAGTSDLPVAEEAAVTAEVFGAEVVRITDVGVAGIHRILGRRAELDGCDCLIVAAGMEGALPSVVGGLTGTPVVALPTSVGYGASFGGIAALLGMLNSCAPGVVVVNIDNGFGAAVHAARVARLAARARQAASRPAASRPAGARGPAQERAVS